MASLDQFGGGGDAGWCQEVQAADLAVSALVRIRSHGSNIHCHSRPRPRLRLLEHSEVQEGPCEKERKSSLGSTEGTWGLEHPSCCDGD